MSSSDLAAIAWAALPGDGWPLMHQLDLTYGNLEIVTLDMTIERLCQHLPGLAPAIRTVFEHVMEAGANDRVLRCCPHVYADGLTARSSLPRAKPRGIGGRLPARFTSLQRYDVNERFQTKRHAGQRMLEWLASSAERARFRERPAPMQQLLEITSDGDIIDDGEVYALFYFDPESLGDDPID